MLTLYFNYVAGYTNPGDSVRDAIRRGLSENEVPKHEEKLTGAWRQISTPESGDDTKNCVQAMT